MTKYLRAQNITDRVTGEVVSILDGWCTKLTWELLIEKVQERLKVRYTRQALHQHERIRLAFVTRKKALLRSNGGPARSTGHLEFDKTLERLDRLKVENERIEAENKALLDQFARWTYNASSRGLSIDFLNQPMPSVDRDQTKTARPKKGKR